MNEHLCFCTDANDMQQVTTRCISAPYPSSGIGRIIRDIQLSEENLKKYRYERLSEIFPRIM